MIQKLDIHNPEIAQKLLDIQIPAYQVEATIIGSTEIPHLQDTVEKIQSSNEMFFGYWEEKSLAGAISFLIESNVVDIHRLVVSPAYFRQGIGAKLLSFLLAKPIRTTKYIVHTGAKNIPAKRLYEKFGFKEIGQMEVAPNLSLSRLEKEVD
ncbi:GNAT family N-acetyltransferase [Baia soyae]|uniref:Acetyltransferase (GNAT) family protein n=1 Tax=Baia soyae TaxID=1544746 RepID=A0A4R2RJM0_9BACL|nr:GNAT family N-acetyltransferase [Baia soyae]TCP64020.1 acetyltransferase (GNAT) family protein [Baia soyae]